MCEQGESSQFETMFEQPASGVIHTGKGDIHIHPAERTTVEPHVSWERLKQSCERISAFHLAILGDKFSSELYVQRPILQAYLDDFLASDKCFFVLVGQSGVGKTNFICNAYKRYRSDENIACVVYDGASLAMVTSLTEQINRDFTDIGRIPCANALRYVEFSNDMTNKRLLLLIDAVNEHRDMYTIIQAIKEVGAQYGQWIKVVISCRPHAWELLYRHAFRVRLPKLLFYSPPGSRSIYVELGDFSNKEMAKAYERYRKLYGFEPSYDSLPSKLKRTLRNPLILWLVAEISREKDIRSQVGGTDTRLIPQYVSHLVTGRILLDRDLDFIEHAFVPLCLKEGQCLNEICVERLAEVWESTEECLDRLIYSGILMRRDESVRFRYERFYDYYIGMHLLRLVESGQVP